jgi:hypothetical protein
MIITQLCRHRAEVVKNRVNTTVRSKTQGEAMHRNLVAVGLATVQVTKLSL